MSAPGETMRCLMEWHYGTIAPVYHVNPDGRTGWKGVHGAPTTNPGRVCDECIATLKSDYPGSTVPEYTAEDAEYWEKV